MTSPNHIRYLRRDQLDPAAWDDCISSSPSGLLYARSLFLDHVTGGQWDGLVEGDYQAVMPLVWNKKYGFSYLYQPHFVPFLGVFRKGTDLASLDDFLPFIPVHFRFWDIDCNETNTLSNPAASSVRPSHRSNYLLPLDRPGSEIRLGYKRLARRMLQKAESSGLRIVRGVDPGEVIQQFRLEYGRRMRHISDRSYQRILASARMAEANDQLAAYLAIKDDGAVQAFYLLFRDNKFVYSVLGGSTGQGRAVGAFYLLTDAAIQDHCNTQRIFRFEGSDLPGIAFFNAQFGANPVDYLHLIRNRLPFPINLLRSGSSLR